jgi:hypothetical protein
MYPLVAGFAVAMGAVLALALPGGAQADVQVKSPPNHVVAIEATATWEANGAAVYVTIDVICPKGASSNVSITVTQAVDGAIVQGQTYRSVGFACVGRPQAVRIGVTPMPKPFAKGVAFGQVDGWWDLPYYGSRSAWDERTIKIV